MIVDWMELLNVKSSSSWAGLPLRTGEWNSVGGTSVGGLYMEPLLRCSFHRNLRMRLGWRNEVAGSDRLGLCHGVTSWTAYHLCSIDDCDWVICLADIVAIHLWWLYLFYFGCEHWNRYELVVCGVVGGRHLLEGMVGECPTGSLWWRCCKTSRIVY
jgi:hypothetical protein